MSCVVGRSGAHAPTRDGAFARLEGACARTQRAVHGSRCAGRGPTGAVVARRGASDSPEGGGGRCGAICRVWWGGRAPAPLLGTARSHAWRERVHARKGPCTAEGALGGGPRLRWWPTRVQATVARAAEGGVGLYVVCGGAVGRPRPY